MAGKKDILEDLAVGHKKTGVKEKIVWGQNSTELGAKNEDKACLLCLQL